MGGLRDLLHLPNAESHPLRLTLLVVRVASGLVFHDAEECLMSQAAHVLEIPYTHALIQALNAPNQQTRVWRQNVGSVVTRNRAGRVTGRFSAGAPVGTGDILGVVRPEGWHIEVETKSHKGRQSEEQIARAELLSRWGAIYVLCGYSDTMSMDENVAAAVAKVDAEIEKRRSK